MINYEIKIESDNKVSEKHAEFAYELKKFFQWLSSEIKYDGEKFSLIMSDWMFDAVGDYLYRIDGLYIIRRKDYSGFINTSLSPEMKWIYTRDALPADKDHVLVSYYENDMGVINKGVEEAVHNKFGEGKNTWGRPDAGGIYGVYAWMPLPDIAERPK